MNAFTNHKIIKYAAWLTLILGVILRGAVWLQQRSIFLDEASLIRNLVEKNYADLFGHLNYQQYAPPFFSVVMKFILNNFGVNELTTRAFSLFCGVAMLPLFYKLGRLFLLPFPLLLAVLTISFGNVFIDYSTECKQYATDGLVAVGLVLLSQILDYKSFSRKNALVWAIVGSLAIWFSMPSVFVLAGVGACYFFHFFKNKNSKAMLEIGAVSAVWLIQFGIYFLMTLKSDAQSGNLQNFHRDYFFAFPPLSIAQFNLLIGQIAGIIDRYIGITSLAAICSVIGFTFGVQTLWRTDKARFLLLLTPILLTLTASALTYYSIITRLILFFMPSVILIIFIGVEHIIQKMPMYVSGLLSLGFAATLVLQIQMLHLLGPFRNDYAQLSDGFEFIKKEKQPDGAVFTPYGISPVVHYYTEIRDKPYRFDKLFLQEYVCCDPNIIEQGVAAIHQKGIKKVWILYDQPEYDLFLDIIKKQNGRILKKQEFHRGVVLLYEIQ